MQAVLIAIGVFFTDRLSKLIVEQLMEQGSSIPLIPNVFYLTYIRNPGAAFGIMAFQKSFFIAVSILVVAGIIIYYRKIPAEKKLMRLAMSLQLGGALGNLVDRLYTGYVTDFLDFRVWPIFNLADSALVIGVILLGWELVRFDRGGTTPKVGPAGGD